MLAAETFAVRRSFRLGAAKPAAAAGAGERGFHEDGNYEESFYA
jgi:hypothetical protein